MNTKIELFLSRDNFVTLTLQSSHKGTYFLVEFSLSVRWLNFGLSSGVRAQHHPINTNLEGEEEKGGARRERIGWGGGETREGRRGKGKERGRRGSRREGEGRGGMKKRRGGRMGEQGRGGREGEGRGGRAKRRGREE